MGGESRGRECVGRSSFPTVVGGDGVRTAIGYVGRERSSTSDGGARVDNNVGREARR